MTFLWPIAEKQNFLYQFLCFNQTFVFLDLTQCQVFGFLGCPFRQRLQADLDLYFPLYLALSPLPSTNMTLNTSKNTTTLVCMQTLTCILVRTSLLLLQNTIIKVQNLNTNTSNTSLFPIYLHHCGVLTAG